MYVCKKAKRNGKSEIKVESKWDNQRRGSKERVRGESALLRLFFSLSVTLTQFLIGFFYSEVGYFFKDVLRQKRHIISRSFKCVRVFSSSCRLFLSISQILKT